MIPTKDLMLGNWVYDSEKTRYPMQVTAIFDDTVYLDFEGNEGDVWECSEKDIVPIPITGELLLKNGFQKRNLLGYHEHFEYTLYGKINFRLIALNDCEFSHAMQHTALKIEHLHQLQNILRLAGVEVEFKI